MHPYQLCTDDRGLAYAGATLETEEASRAASRSARSVACVLVRAPTGDRPYRPDRSTARREEEEDGLVRQSASCPAAGSQVSDDMAEEEDLSHSAAMAELISLGRLKPVPDIVLKRPWQSVNASMGISDASGPSVRCARSHAV